MRATQKEAITTAYKQTLSDWPELEMLFAQRVSEHFEHAQKTYPQIDYPIEYFALDIGQHLYSILCKEQEPQMWFERFLPEDFLLANACVAHRETALQIFEQLYIPHLHTIASRYETTQLKASDLVQTLYQKLIVGDERKGPKLKHYAGQGALRSWLKITATRHFIDMGRQDNKHKPETLVEEQFFERLIDSQDDLELDFLKTTYRQAFKRAFALAIEQLSAKDRNLLNQHIVGGLSIDKLGQLHNVHRATAARWIVTARTNLVIETKKQMKLALKVDEDELDSIMRMIRSRASVSISRLLKIDDTPE